MLKLFSILLTICLYVDVVLSDINHKLPEKINYHLDDADNLFKEFATKYNKKYSSKELEHRRNVFVDNLVKINRWNREQEDAVYGIGPFTDLTFEEFTENYTGCLGNFTTGDAIKYEPKGKAPDSLDWRQKNIVTRVKDQGSCGSCYIFSAIGNIESQYAKSTGQLIELSEQQSLDCGSNGCNGGVPHLVMQTLAKQGCMRDSDYPYEAKEGKCRLDRSKVAVHVASGQMLVLSSEDDLKDAVANYGPLAIGLYTNEQWPLLSGGVLKPTTPCNKGAHAVLLVGYGSDNGEPYWLIKNSWGEDWNEEGYLRLIRGQRACDIGQYVASATIA